MKKSLIDFWILESIEAGVELLIEAGIASSTPAVLMATTGDEFFRILKGSCPEAEAATISWDDS